MEPAVCGENLLTELTCWQGHGGLIPFPRFSRHLVAFKFEQFIYCLKHQDWLLCGHCFLSFNLVCPLMWRLLYRPHWRFCHPLLCLCIIILYIYIMYVPDWLVHTNLDICKTPYIYFLTLIHLTTTRTQWARSSKPLSRLVLDCARLSVSVEERKKRANSEKASERKTAGGKRFSLPSPYAVFRTFFSIRFPHYLRALNRLDWFKAPFTRLR